MENLFILHMDDEGLLVEPHSGTVLYRTSDQVSLNIQIGKQLLTEQFQFDGYTGKTGMEKFYAAVKDGEDCYWKLVGCQVEQYPLDRCNESLMYDPSEITAWERYMGREVPKPCSAHDLRLDERSLQITCANGFDGFAEFEVTMPGMCEKEQIEALQALHQVDPEAECRELDVSIEVYRFGNGPEELPTQSELNWILHHYAEVQEQYPFELIHQEHFTVCYEPDYER